ncbi:hypothetical protein CI105_03800 [Candidatus Izimaplasma bacterium ZiA1]|uniref:bifunctional metallophosphatase/5'-nucleotidase n=1 Tax=Candidatus Izimoplasma sp. ZiA1 TaxID=2024899 RepID=UPI000BAA9019|nr:hypothetical protein CI105_03800 [Candidatus Izimaplasma bacterium ZiA1]
MKNIKVFHTSDTHGYITSQSFIDKKKSIFSLSKISSYILKNKDKSTIIIDTGDTLQGSPLTYFFKNNYIKYSNPITNIFNHIGYDFFIPGNHDFNYGLNYLNNFTEKLEATTLSCNILKLNNDSYFDKKYDIKLVNDVKIAIIGATTDYINKWEATENICGLLIEDSFISIRKTVDEVKTMHNPDIIILAYHGGVEKDLLTNIYTDKNIGENIGYKVFMEIKDIDIVLTGHQHRLINHNIQNRVLIQPGSKGQYLSEINITIDDNCKIITSKLLDMQTENHDKEIMSQNKNIINDSEVFFDQVIGYNKANDLLITDRLEARLNKHKIVTLINTMQLEITNADISGTSLANFASGFNKEISIRDVLNTYVYPNTLVVVEINGKELKKILEHHATFFDLVNNNIIISTNYIKPKLELYNYVMFDGISYTINVSNDLGNKITNLKFQNKEVQKEDSFKLCINNYRASGAGNENIYEHLNIIKEYPFDISELLMNYIKDKKNIIISNNNNITIKK